MNDVDTFSMMDKVSNQVSFMHINTVPDIKGGSEEVPAIYFTSSGYATNIRGQMYWVRTSCLVHFSTGNNRSPIFATTIFICAGTMPV